MNTRAGWLKGMRRALPIFILAVCAVFLLPLFDVQAYQIKRVVRGSTTLSSSTEVLTLDISSLLGTPVVGLDLANSFLIASARVQTNDRRVSNVIAQIDDSTHLLFARFTSGVALDVEYTIVEFLSGGVTVFSGMTTVAELITSKVITLPQNVDLTKAFPLITVRSFRSGTTTDENNMFSAEVTAANQLTITRSQALSAYNCDVAYQVIVFDRDVRVQHGMVTIPVSTATATVNLNAVPTYYPVIPAKSFLVFTTKPDAVVDGVEERYAVDGVITDANTLTFRRATAGSATTVQLYWYVVEMQNEAFFKSGSAAFNNAGELTQNVSLAPDALDLGRSICVHSVSGGTAGGQSNLDEILFTSQLSGASQLTLTRNPVPTSNLAANVSWSVGEFAPLDIIAPNGSEVWKVGETQNITWKHSDSLKTGGTQCPALGGKHCVNLDLSTNGGSTYPLSIATGVDGTLDTYAWTIPATISTTNLIGTQLRVKIADTDLAQRNFDVSNGNFEIKGTLTLTSPVGAETWYIGDTTRTITWNNTGDLNGIAPGTLTIKLSSNGGTSYDHTITTAVAAGNGAGGSYTWNPIPETMDAVNLIGANRRVKLILNSDNTVTSQSTGNFTLKGKITVTAPTTGLEEWPIGTSQNITWSKNGVMTTVTLLYSTNSGGTYPNTIVAGIDATGVPVSSYTYAWSPIPATATNFGRVKVMSDADNSVFGVSGNDFKIIASILVTSPTTGNEVWRVSESQNITWDLGGTVNNVCLQYSKDAGPYVNILTPVCSMLASLRTYAWTIPDIISNSVKVKIYNVDAPSIFDESDAPFKIKGKLVVLSPNNGMVYSVGSSQVIQWNAAGTMGNVAVKFAQNGVDYLSTLTLPAGVPASDQNFPWNPIPDAITSNGKVRVELISDAAGVNAESAGVFAIKGTLTLTYPAGGETFSVAAPCTITWTKNGTLGNVEIRYSTDGGLNYPPTQVVATGVAASDLSLAWPGGIPDAIGSAVRVKIFLISDGTVYHTSLSNFAIKGSLTLTSPNLGTERWEVGTFKNITWTRQGSSMGTVRLDYSVNNGADGYPYNIAIAVVSADLTKSWQIPNAIGTLVRVKVALESDATTNDISDAPFAIIGRLVLSAPVGGETWYVGVPQNITWTSYGTMPTVNLYYSTNGGVTYPASIVTGAANLDGYLWTIPDAIGASTRVKVENFADTSVLSVSPANFTVKGRVVVASPNGTEVWRVGETRNITWTPYGSIGNVDIFFSTDGGATYPPANQITPVGGIAASLGSYPWLIPDQIGANLKIKIVSISDSTVVDESNAVFNIKGTLTLTAPNGAQTFTVNDPTNITWTKTGTLGNVELRYSTDAGVTYPVGNVIATAIAATATPYPWTIPDAMGSQVRVKVLLLSDSTGVFDESDNNFTIKGSLALTAPNGTEVWEVSAPRNITWTKNGSIANVKLEYSTDGGTTYPNTIIASTSAATGSYSWTIPDSISASVKVKVTDLADATVSDVSNANFTIKGKIVVTYPNGAETLIVGTSYNILWNSYGTLPTVNLYYSTNGGATYPANIATAVVNANSFGWAVPDIIGTQVRVKVENFNDTSVFSTSTADFTVKGSVNLTYPNGAETLIVGENRTITWTRTGSIGNVEIRFSTDGGATYPVGNIITPPVGVPAGNLSFAWVVPDQIGINVKLKIASLTYLDVLDESNAVFTIKGSVALTAPIGGEVLSIGDPNFNITWTKTGTIGNVKLEYSTDGGATYPLLINGSVDSALLTYSWPIPNNPTTQAKVKITALADGTVADASDLNFRIRGSLTLSAPNGTETWLVGAQQSITWTMTGAIANAKLEYSTDGGITYPNVIIASTPAAAGSYAWTIPDAVTSQARVKITDAGDATVTDASNANFSIKPSVTLGAPNGGDVFTVNSVQSITWSMVGTIANVKLEYSTDGGTTYPNVIISSTPAAALSYSWTVPDMISNTCMVKVSSVSDSSVNDVSNAYFKIRGSLTLTAPNGTEAWPITTIQSVTWTKVGSIASVKLEYSTNAFFDELQTVLIVASVSATLGTPYSWTIPDAPGTNVKVRVTDVSDSTVFDLSNAPFSIKGTLTISAPNGTEQWVVGTTQNITWSKFGNIANVELRYSTDAGTTYPVGNVIIASTPAANLSYSWTIPDAIGGLLRVKIIDTGDASVFDESNANFSIKGSVTVALPNGGETWLVGETRNITWTRSGSFANVKLEYSTNAFFDELQTTVITASTLASALSYPWTVPDAIGTNLKVRISDSANASVVDTSNGTFTIKGILALTAPNGAETWIVGATQNITWNRTGSIANAKLEYSTDAGVTYPNVIIAATPAATGTYGWIIPDSIGNQLRVRVTDATDATVNDTSNANFTIKGSLTLTAPNGAEQWAVGTSQTISWTKTGTIATVKLDYSTNAFFDELQTVLIVASTAADPLPTDNAGSYSWTIPDAISSNVKVRVSNTADATVNDVSNTAFKIVGSLTLTAPNGGDGWVVGTSREITWTRTGSIANVRLVYSVNAGTSYDYLIVVSTPGGTLSYFWTLPDTVSTNVKVKISDAADSTVFDESNAVFKIQAGFTLIAPDGGEVWTVGASQNITWSTVGTTPSVKLEYSADGGLTYPNIIIATTPNTGAYAWTIPDAISTTLRVKVSDVNDASASDASAGNFKIRGGLTLTVPNGAEIWTVGSARNVTWTKSGSIVSVKLEYSTDGGLTYPNLISASVVASLGTFAWTIPDSISSQVKVRIADTSDGTVFDVSNADFSIKGTLALSAPNGTEQWVVGTGQNITWSRNGSIANVKLEYSADSGVTYPNIIIVSTPAALGTYNWTIPDAISTTLRVRVSDAADAAVFDTSDADFAIRGSLTLGSPNGGEIWTVGESRSLTWTRVGSIANVKLEYSTDAGVTYPNVIVAVTGAAVGSYAWTVPDSIGGQLRVKVTDTSNAAVFDISNANFTIKGSLTVTAPNGAETWTVGISQNLTWNKTGSIVSVKLEYSTDGGLTYPNIIAASAPAAGGFYAWAVADAIGTQLRVRISDVSDATVSDTSDANFTIKGSLTLTAPNGGEAWGVGTNRNITWTRTGSIANVKLEYSTDGGLTYPNIIIASTDAATGSFAWLIPDNINSTVRVKVTNIADTSVFDVSDLNFKIVGVLTLVAPNGSDSWGVATAQNITWTKSGSISNVRLDYSTNSGVAYPNTIIASTPGGSLAYLWTIPDAVSNQVRVKISDASDTTVFDASDADFSIRVRFDITSPDGGEVWEVNSVHDLTWTRIGSTANAKLEYSTDGGGTYPYVIAASTLNSGSYSWTVPDTISSSVKVRVSDVNNANANDVSAGNFKIRGGITVTAPNGTEAWIVGTIYNITWTKVGSIANVKIEYSTDGGLTYPYVITALIGSGTGLYAWTVPDTLSQTARVKITDASDSAVYDASNADFKIRGSLTVISPNGAEIWEVNAVQNLTWNRTGSIPTVKLEYSTDGGTTYPNTIIASTDASTGTYPWTVPDSIGNLVRVRIVNTTDATVFDESNANFRIRGVVRVIAPNGGEVWGVAAVQNLTWTITGTIANVKLEYSTDGGLTFPNLIIASTAAAVGSYGWTVPDNLTLQARVRVSNVTDATVYDDSDANFRIVGQLAVTSPNGGEVWPVASVQSITWSKVGSIVNVKLEYSTDGGVTYPNTIVASTPASALSYAWTIPDAIFTTVKVKITDLNDATVFDASDANFKIRGSLVLNTPNGNEVWLINSNQAVTWTKNGSIANVRLDYSIDAGTTYPYNIIASIAAGLQTYNWVIPDNPNILVRVKVADAGDPTVFDASNGNFIIRGGFTLATPNGGEQWPVGSTQNITWSTFGTIPNVKIEYSTNTGSTWNVVVNSVANTGVYSWTVPDAISSSCLVRIYDLNDPNAMDVSNAVFKIHGSLSLTAPNGAEAWGVGSSQNILWTKTGSIANVKLEYSTDGGTTYPNIIVAATPAAALSYSWTIPDSISTSVKVRISDTNDAAVFDISDGVFKIKGAFLLSAPNGGEAWIVASAQNITWSTFGTVASVKLEYSIDAGITWNLIAASVANAGTYSWTVPDAISAACRVRVSDVNDSTALDGSDNNFKIRGDLVLTVPNGGEKWNVGSSQVITWNRTGSIANVKLEYSDNGGATFVPIINSTPNTGSYSWTIPNAITIQARVRITNVDDTTVTDTSNANFKIQGTLTLISPNGGEAWIVGSSHDVTWTTGGTINFVKLEYSTDSGVTYPNLIISSLANVGIYSWTVPDNVSGTVKIKVSDASDPEAFDASNGDFRIRTTFVLTSPNGAEVWKVGSAYNVTWSSVGAIPNVKLEYSRFNFLTDVNVIAASAPNTGTYSWTIPDTISNTVRVRVSNPNDAGALDDSNADFRIITGLTVNAPNGAEMWDVGSTQNITWTCTSAQANVPQVKLEYSTDGGATFPYIIAAATNNGTYAWLVPDTISAQFKVRVSDLADSTAFDISDNNAKIRAKFTVASPNGGEVWTVGEARNVTWSSVGTVANVKLDYSLNDFATAVPITVTTPNNGTFSWTLPDALSGAGTSVTTAKVRVMSTTDTDAFDASNANFKIRGALLLTAPNGGELWLINQSNNIAWTTTGTISNVRLVYSTDSGITYPSTIIVSTPNTNSYSWLIPDTPTPNARVRILDAGDTTVYDDSDANFRIRGFFTLTSPNGGESWLIGSTQNITWIKGGTIGYKISYSTDSGATYPNVVVTNLDPAQNLGSYGWTIPGTVADADRTKIRVKIEDPNDNTVYGASNTDFTIKGSLVVTVPNGAERWVTNEARTIAWTTPAGPIANVKLEYSTDGGATYATIVASTPNTGLYNWTVPNNRSTTAKVRVTDTANAAISDASDANFTIDYYRITWELRDLLTNELLTNLSVAEVVYGTTTYNWQAAGLTAPLTHDTPYGYWTTTWTLSGYGDKAQNFTADRDQTFVLFMETTAIHIWRAYTNFAYTASVDSLAVTSWLERDGFVVTGAVSVQINIYDTGTLIKTITSNTPDVAGFFNMIWTAPTGLVEGKVYSVVADITNASGAHFKTPNSFQITEAKRLQSTENAMIAMRDITLPQFQSSLTTTVTTKLDDQTALITTKMDEQKSIITTKTDEMVSSVNTALTSFETKANTAVTKLQAGADQAVAAGTELEATAKKFSWKVTVSPNPALVGDLLTFNCQGQPDMTPMISIYSHNDNVIVADQVMLQSTPGLYVYEIIANREKFAPGKAYTYIVSEQVTGGLVSGSGMVESTSITTIAGLAAAAPEAERTAKKVLEAVQTLQNVLVSDNPINIGLALTELQKSVDDLPNAVAKEAGLAPTARTLNEIADKLGLIVGKKEGIDIGAMLEEALNDSPTIKDIRGKTDAIQGVIKLLMQLFEAKFGGSDVPVVSTSLAAGSVKFRIAAANPSKLKPQKVPVKVYLPQEVKPKDVMDLGGLNLEFDQEKSIYYVYSNDIELNPLETRLFEVEVEDIWFVPKEATGALKSQTDAIVNNLKETAYRETAETMSASIYQRLDTIVKSQNDESVSREQHIGIYRNNLQVITGIKEDIARLEKLLVSVGGLPEPSMLKNVKIKGDAPTRKVTWIIIFVIMIFIGLLAGVFFFTWNFQLRSSENLLKDAKKESFPDRNPFRPGGEKKT